MGLTSCIDGVGSGLIITMADLPFLARTLQAILILASESANGFKNHIICLGGVNGRHEVVLEHAVEPGGEFPIRNEVASSSIRQRSLQMSGSAVAMASGECHHPQTVLFRPLRILLI